MRTRQRAQAAQRQPAVERRAGQAPGRQHRRHALPAIGRSAQQSQDDVAVAVHRLGHAFHHPVGAQLVRAGRSPARPACCRPTAPRRAVGQLGQRRQVGDAQQRIADRFDHQQLGVRRQSAARTASRSQVSTTRAGDAPAGRLAASTAPACGHRADCSRRRGRPARAARARPAPAPPCPSW